MCILFLAINQRADFPLIICANRDEFYARPTSAAHFWIKNPDLLAGQDLEAGGSWLGITKQGRFAAITNIRTGSKATKNKRSRGELVVKALQNVDQINYQWLLENSDQYSPFNLVYGSVDQLQCFNSVNHIETPLVQGFHAISNGALDDQWPKMSKGEKLLEQIVLSQPSIQITDLLGILKDQTQAEEALLPKTGVSFEWEKLLSSIFIRSADYGTRSSNLILLNDLNQLEFIEVSYDQQAKQTTPNHFYLELER